MCWLARGTHWTHSSETTRTPAGHEWNNFTHTANELVTVVEGRMRLTFFDTDHYILEPGGEAGRPWEWLPPWFVVVHGMGKTYSATQATICCQSRPAALPCQPCPTAFPCQPRPHPTTPDEIFIPAGVPHSTKNIAAVNSKWFYVSGGAVWIESHRRAGGSRQTCRHGPPPGCPSH